MHIDGSNVPWFELPGFDAHARRRDLTPAAARAAHDLHHDGVAVLPGVVPDDLRARIIDEMSDDLADASRVQDAWRRRPGVLELALLPTVLDVLRQVYGRGPVPFQTLNFARGTEQSAHSDQVHFNSIPSRFMCGVWAALEDVDEGNGPLCYYPGSHRLPDTYFQRFGLAAGLEHYPGYERAQLDLLESCGLERREYHASARDVMIWASNLVHGGAPITEKGRTRWSQVTHYFFDGCVYVTPLFSDPEVGEWFVRRDLVQIGAGTPEVQTLNGDDVTLTPIGLNGRVRISRAGAPPSTQRPQPRVRRTRTSSTAWRTNSRRRGPSWRPCATAAPSGSATRCSARLAE